MELTRTKIANGVRVLSISLGLFSTFFCCGLMNGQETRVELGAVNWNRDYNAAKKQSAQTGKPVLILFQEVPGWSTCQNFGSGPLSQPLMVEAIEDLFVPVLVYNNKEQDESLLKSFDEPAWNNPVVRFLDGNGKDVIARKDGVWETGPLAERMIESLEAVGHNVPAYLRHVTNSSQQEYKRASFAMLWYWEGEAQLGSLEGVNSTHSLWVGNKEVVHVEYDPDVIEYRTLLENAASMDCTNAVYTYDADQAGLARQAGIDEVVEWKDSLKTRKVQTSEQKYYLRNSIYRHLPLNESQAVKVNSALTGDPSKVDAVLSPRQLQLFKRIKAAVEDDGEALKEFEFPGDQSDLIGHQQTLLTTLDRLEKSKMEQ